MISNMIPTGDELKGLTRWARVVLLARAVRRIQPFFLEGWPEAPVKFQEAIERAIAFGENSAAEGKPSSGAQATALAAMDAYGKEPDEITFTKGYVNHVPFAASRVAFACAETEPFFAHDGLVEVLRGVRDFGKVKKQRYTERFARVINGEFQFLLQASRQAKWKKNTPVTSELLGPLWPHRPPKGWPELRAVNLGRAPRIKKVDLKALKLPRELVAFLKAGKKLKYSAAKTEVGPVVLHPLEHLQIRTFEVIATGTTVQGRDPNHGKQGHYLVKAVDLVAENDAYGPDGILAWIPGAKCFCQWDPDHLKMLVFPGAKWADIAARPAKYLDAQWNDHDAFARHLEPWKYARFVKKSRRTGI